MAVADPILISCAGDLTLIRVNDVDVRFDQLVKQLAVGNQLNFFDRFARNELVRQLAVQKGIELAREDLQARVDEWRYKFRLENIEDTENWLHGRGITLQDVANDAEITQLEYLLSKKIIDEKIQPYFTQNRSAFDEAEICWIFHADENVMEEINLQVREDGADFYAMARRFSEDESTRPASGFLGRLRPTQLPKGISPRIFACASGKIVGPEKVAGGFGLYLIQCMYKAKLDERIRDEIRTRLFEQWL